MANILILGGTAWLGHEVARQAIAGGHQVTCLARGTAAAPEGAELVVADRDTHGAYAEVVSRSWNVVIDVSRQPGHVRRAVTDLHHTLGGGQWIFVSSASAYVDDLAQLTGDESDPVRKPLAFDVATSEQYGEAKVACENAVMAAFGAERSTVARVGMIAGPGDFSDRLGYWPAAFARARSHGGPMLIPAVRDQPVQAIDLRDLAAFLIRLGHDRTGGIFDTFGAPMTFGDWIDASAAVAGFTGDIVEVEPGRLVEQQVGYWSGPKSLPLWLPPDHELTVRRKGSAAVAAGMHRRPVADTLADVLADETARGLDRERRAGLSRDEELDILAAFGS